MYGCKRYSDSSCNFYFIEKGKNIHLIYFFLKCRKFVISQKICPVIFIFLGFSFKYFFSTLHVIPISESIKGVTRKMEYHSSKPRGMTYTLAA